MKFFFLIPTLLSCKKFEFILSSFSIYLFIPDQTLKALLEMLRDQQLLMTSIRFMAQSKQWTNVFTLSYSKPRHLWNELLLRQCQCYVIYYSKFDRESLLFILHLDISGILEISSRFIFGVLQCCYCYQYMYQCFHKRHFQSPINYIRGSIGTISYACFLYCSKIVYPNELPIISQIKKIFQKDLITVGT